MKIVADENIPHLSTIFGKFDLVCKPGREITHQDLLDADVLLVRSVTTVNDKLLQNTRIKFVGSTTSGYEHLDTQWLDKNNIDWYVAEGCNTQAVVEYFMSVLAALDKDKIINLKNLRAAVIGVGRIGSKVADFLRKINVEVIECDPIRALHDKTFHSTPFEEITDVDLITFHVPLTKEDNYPTFHLADKNFFLKQKKNCVIVNTSRGSVIDSNALKEYGQLLYPCLDVWENEPYIDFEVLELATIATPHIAGYSVQAKLRGIEMVYQYMLDNNIIKNTDIAFPNYPTKKINFTNSWQEKTLAAFDPRILTKVFKQAMIEDEKSFDVLRKNFNERYELEYFLI